jgi:hypothetical protein
VLLVERPDIRMHRRRTVVTDHSLDAAGGVHIRSDATASGRNRRAGSEDFERDLRGLSQKYRSRATAPDRNPSERSTRVARGPRAPANERASRGAGAPTIKKARFPRVTSEEAAIRQSQPKLTQHPAPWTYFLFNSTSPCVLLQITHFVGGSVLLMRCFTGLTVFRYAKMSLMSASVMFLNDSNGMM